MKPSRMTPEQAKRLTLAEQHEWYRRLPPAGRCGRRCRGRRARRPGRPAGRDGRSASAGPPGGAASPMLITKSGGELISVPPFGRHIAFGGDPASQISVAWQVPAQVSNPFIRVGTTPWDLSERLGAEVRALTTQRATPVRSTPCRRRPRHDRAVLPARQTSTGLRSGHTYYYASATRAGTRAAGSRRSAASPRRRPARIPFTFTAFGDQGVSYDAVGTTALIRARIRPSTCTPATSPTPRPAATAWSPTPTTRGSGTRSSPRSSPVPRPGSVAWSPSATTRWSPGTRPTATAASRPLRLPRQRAVERPYYSFIYGNVGVVSLDANDVSYEIPANNGYTGGAQTAWLAQRWPVLRAQPDVDFIVVYFHHCAYCTCTAHGSDGGVRELWVPLFDHYERRPGHQRPQPHLRADRPAPRRPGDAPPRPIGATVTPATEGTTYITAGRGRGASTTSPRRTATGATWTTSRR